MGHGGSTGTGIRLGHALAVREQSTVAIVVKLERAARRTTDNQPAAARLGEEQEDMQFSGRISSLFAKICLNPSVYNPR